MEGPKYPYQPCSPNQSFEMEVDGADVMSFPGGDSDVIPFPPCDSVSDHENSSFMDNLNSTVVMEDLFPEDANMSIAIDGMDMLNVSSIMTDGNDESATSSDKDGDEDGSIVTYNTTNSGSRKRNWRDESINRSSSSSSSKRSSSSIESQVGKQQSFTTPSIPCESGISFCPQRVSVHTIDAPALDILGVLLDCGNSFYPKRVSAITIEDHGNSFCLRRVSALHLYKPLYCCR
jgi:hypothetical protein